MNAEEFVNLKELREIKSYDEGWTFYDHESEEGNLHNSFYSDIPYNELMEIEKEILSIKSSVIKSAIDDPNTLYEYEIDYLQDVLEDKIKERGYQIISTPSTMSIDLTR